MWLDGHNLLGIAGAMWMSVVGVTGVVNTLATPIQQAWQAGRMTEMTRAYAGRPALAPVAYGSLDRAMRNARAALPGDEPAVGRPPRRAFSSRHHYGIFFQGETPLTRDLLTVALVSAATGAVTDTRAMPWTVKALSLSRPLHFGDYGGLPMKLLWAVLDLFAIVVLGRYSVARTAARATGGAAARTGERRAHGGAALPADMTRSTFAVPALLALATAMG
ncbi:PepSY domain-containing protein [Sphingomonas sp. MMS24-JH45]